MSKHLDMNLYSDTGVKLHASLTLAHLECWHCSILINLSTTVEQYNQYGTIYTNAKIIYLNILFI
jgi:hypothetical protein